MKLKLCKGGSRNVASDYDELRRSDATWCGDGRATAGCVPQMNLNIQSVLTALAPILFAAVGYLITSLNELESRIQKTEGYLMLLVTPQGEIVASPANSIERQKMREDFMRIIHDMQVRIKLLEAGK